MPSHTHTHTETQAQTRLTSHPDGSSSSRSQQRPQQQQQRQRQRTASVSAAVQSVSHSSLVFAVVSTRAHARNTNEERTVRTHEHTNEERELSCLRVELHTSHLTSHNTSPHLSSAQLSAAHTRTRTSHRIASRRIALRWLGSLSPEYSLEQVSLLAAQWTPKQKGAQFRVVWRYFDRGRADFD